MGKKSNGGKGGGGPVENLTEWKQDSFSVNLSLQRREEWPQATLEKNNLITTIDFSTNRLVSLPPNFGNLNHIVRLDFSNNELAELPESFGELLHLRWLDLSNNRLTELPYSFGELKALQRLNLMNNPINPEVLPLEAVGPCITDADCKMCAKKIVPYLAKVWAKAEKAAEKKAKKLDKRADKLAVRAAVAEAEEREERKKEKAALRALKQAAWAKENPEEAAAFAAKKAAEADTASAAAGVGGGGDASDGEGALVKPGYSHSILRYGILLIVIGNLILLALTKFGYVSDADIAVWNAKIAKMVGG